jgi:hypothetical protein
MDSNCSKHGAKPGGISISFWKESTFIAPCVECTQRCYATWRQSSKTALPKGRQPRPPLLHLYPTRNTASKEDKSGNLQTTPTKEPTSLQHPPWQSTIPNYGRSMKFPLGTSSPPEVKWNGSWPWWQRGWL